jgi:hypothetical protein
MHLIHPATNPSLLLSYEQLYITDLSQRGQLIPEQNANDANPLVRLVLSPSTNPKKHNLSSSGSLSYSTSSHHRYPRSSLYY